MHMKKVERFIFITSLLAVVISIVVSVNTARAELTNSPRPSQGKVDMHMLHDLKHYPLESELTVNYHTSEGRHI